MRAQMKIRIGHSPDPDDAFMFYALNQKELSLPGFSFEHVIEDIQSLNERAINAELEITAISAHAYAYVASKYYLMRSGASMGFNYGPVVVSRERMTRDELCSKEIAIPGKLTTAGLLLKLAIGEYSARVIPFDKIMAAVQAGEVQAGLVIHEGQITHPSFGLRKVLDLGEWWHEETGGLPVPLGLDVVRRDLGKPLATKLSGILRNSIETGFNNKEEAVTYAMQYSRGTDRVTTEKFIRMYVNRLTDDLGSEGSQALEKLYQMGFVKGLLPPVNLEFV